MKVTNEQLTKVRDALAKSVEHLDSPPAYVIAAVDILDAALAAPEQVNPTYKLDGFLESIGATYTLPCEIVWQGAVNPTVGSLLRIVGVHGRHLYLEQPVPQSQPVARVTGYYGGNCVIEPLDGKTVVSSGMAVYSAPVAAQAAQPDPWISVKDAMPKSGVIVLAYYINSHNHSRRIRAKWTAAKTEEANAEFYWGEYDEETDTYWTPEGWYECIDNWDEFSSIMVSEGEITHWMPLPLAPDDPNYTAPPSREWQGLTDEEIKQVLRHPTWSLFDYAKAISSALRAKNTGEQA